MIKKFRACIELIFAVSLVQVTLLRGALVTAKTSDS